MGLISVLLCFGLAISCSLAVPQHKAELIPDKGVVGTDTSGNNFNGKITSSDSVSGDFAKSGGARQTLKADTKVAANGHQDVEGIGLKGEKYTGDINKNAKNGIFKSAKGDVVNADASNSANINAVVHPAGNKPAEKYLVAMSKGDDQAIVTDPKGKKYQVDGLKTNGDNVDITGGKNPLNARFQTKKDGDAIQSINTRLKEKTFLNYGPAFDVNTNNGDANSMGNVQMAANPVDSGAKSPFDALTPSVSVKVDKIKVQSCPEKEFADAFGDNGIKIIDSSIGAEVKPISVVGGVKTYGVPSCFTMKATIQIPPQYDVSQIAVQATVFVSPIGNLACDKNFECADTTTQDRPSGPCFFCDLCNPDAHKKAGELFKSNTNLDKSTCISSSRQIPVSWEVCPPEGSTNKWKVFQPDITSIFKTDMDNTIRVYLKTKASSAPASCAKLGPGAAALFPGCKAPPGGFEKWQLVGCREAIISYSAATPTTSLGQAAKPGK